MRRRARRRRGLLTKARNDAVHLGALEAASLQDLTRHDVAVGEHAPAHVVALLHPLRVVRVDRQVALGARRGPPQLGATGGASGRHVVESFC